MLFRNDEFDINGRSFENSNFRWELIIACVFFLASVRMAYEFSNAFDQEQCRERKTSLHGSDEFQDDEVRFDILSGNRADATSYGACRSSRSRSAAGTSAHSKKSRERIKKRTRLVENPFNPFSEPIAITDDEQSVSGMEQSHSDTESTRSSAGERSRSSRW